MANCHRYISRGSSTQHHSHPFAIARKPPERQQVRSVAELVGLSIYVLNLFSELSFVNAVCRAAQAAEIESSR